MPNPLTGLTQIKSTDITDGSITDAKISPSPSIPATKISVDLGMAEAQTPFNIGVLGFKMAVNEGLTIYNLLDGIVDEFNSEGGIDTSENSNASYESSSDFYQNLTPTPGVAMHLGVDAVTFENPAHAPLITFTSQEATFGAFGTQGSITFPTLTTSIEATMVGAGGSGNGNGEGGAGGSVQGTITNPSIAGATWDYVVGEGGTAPQYSTCLLYTSPSPRDKRQSRMPSSA